MEPENARVRVAEIAKTLNQRAEHKLAEVEGVNVYLTSYLGDYPAHKHPKDEFFYVVQGELQLEYEGRQVTLKEGDCFPVKKETVHKPSAKTRTLVLKVEPRDFPFEVTEKE